MIGVVGLPILPNQPEKSGRFPCEACPCGCSSAEYCWDKCCCFSDTEKLKWAFENDVSPPEFLIARVGQAKANLVKFASHAGPAACCCCSGSASDKTEPSCSLEPRPQGPHLAKTQSTDAPSLRIVLLEDAARCHGIDMVWSLLSSVTVDSPSPLVAKLMPPFLYYLLIGNERANSVTQCPDPPVP